MKKSILLVVAVVMFALVLSACAQQTAAVGTPLITISGKIQTKNSGDTYVLDEAAFTAKSVELTYNDPWMGNGLKYKGILLKDLIAMINPSSDATTLSLIATDGKALDVPIADAQKYDLMLAHWSNGTVLNTDTGGPVKIAIPDDAKTNYKDEQWMWWLVKVEVK